MTAIALRLRNTQNTGELLMSDQALREHVLYLLKDGGAHLNFEQAIADLPEDIRGAKVEGVSHTLWRLLEHLRICQWDNHEIATVCGCLNFTEETG